MAATRPGWSALAAPRRAADEPRMRVTPVLFLHGLESNPQGKKARWLAARYLAHAPALTTRHFPTALEEARAAIRAHAPAVLVGSSFGGALLLALMMGGDWRGPAVFVAQAGLKIGIGDRLPDGARAILVHGTSDEVVDFEGSERLAASAPRTAELWPVPGGDHRLDSILEDGTLARAVDKLLLELSEPRPTQSAAAAEHATETIAAGYAVARHGGQRYGDRPYVAHLAAVRAVLSDALSASSLDPGTQRALGVAAWLHDVVEDTSATQGEIEARFGADVSALVWAVTGVGSTREERSAAAYEKIRATPHAVWLKLADRIANVEASGGRPDKRAMYASEQAAFRAALDRLGPSLQTSALWARLDAALAVGV